MKEDELITIDCAIVIQNLIQFQSLENDIQDLMKNNISIDIYVPTSEDNEGFKEMYDYTYNFLSQQGYNPKRNLSANVKYKILLESNPTDTYYKFKFDYRIKYRYGPVSVKPMPVYLPEFNLCYDAILCYGDYEADILNVYSDTFVVENSKYRNYRRKQNVDKSNLQKPTLLYLPTYGDISSIDSIIDIISGLKNDYNVIIKLHHGTSYLKNETRRLEKLREITNGIYDQNTKLIELLEKADVVLSDNSGAIFEAVYGKVPVAIFAKDINKNKIGNMNTIQYNAIEQGYIPYTNDIKEIRSILKRALSNENVTKQLQLRDKIFSTNSEQKNTLLSIVNNYLNNTVNMNHKNLHDVLVGDYYKKLENVYEYSKIIEQLNNDINEKNKEINYYENGKLYKISRWIYKLYFKLIRKDTN